MVLKYLIKTTFHAKGRYITGNILNLLEERIKKTFKMYEVSASIGAVYFDENGKDYKTLIKKADEKMYWVKENGKGKVFVQLNKNKSSKKIFWK